MPRTTPVIYREIRDRLGTEISHTPAHTRIRSRRDLMQTYRVSRTTIDRAISELIGQGALYSKNGSGTYVAEKASTPLPGGTLQSLGLLLPDIRSYTYPGILRGIEHVSFDRRVNLIVGNIENRASRQTHYLRNFVDSGVSGVIIVPARPNPEEDLEGQLFSMLRELQARDIPFVFCNRNTLGIEAPQVVSNDFHGGFLATRHLLEQG
ncbi:GntR family transcriptional regulator, partial [Desulfoluna sp.]|uniref:GntR family transcriptional regulator n=1 Tax=Desulfoluna sp. TaxID=2045199 RepID=UPI0026112A3A